MAKRKKTKENKSGFSYSVELTGLILILIGIIGFGFGSIGTLIKKFAMFLSGTYWYIVLISLLIIGIYMLFKRTMPKFFSVKLVGFYILVIALLSYSHIGFLNEEITIEGVFSATYENYIQRMNTINVTNALTTSGTSTIVVGGGFIGCLFISLFNAIAGITGSKIILIVFLIFGAILAFDINISKLLNSLTSKIKNLFTPREKEKKDIVLDDNGDLDLNEPKITKHNEDEEVDDRIVITSIDQIKNKPVAEIVERNEIVNLSNNENDSKESSYKLPTFSLLNPVKIVKQTALNNNETRANKEILERVIKDFGINAKVVEIHIGPSVTQYEITVPHGTKVSRISGIHKEIALAMAAKDVRIEAPIPGKSTIGVEIPNGKISPVGFREVLEATASKDPANKIFVALGKDLMGRSILEDISKMPHLLVAGSTGSGKSVCINSMISSILMRYKPSEVKLVLVDPKKVELTNYNGIPHLLCPVVSDPKKASITLQKIVSEMDKRYEIFSDKKVKNIAGYNEMIDKENKKHPESPVTRMPYIVVIIDELADLMLVASKEVEDSIMRITQMARAAGIHLIVATQRPSTDVITGLIKNNIPSRIAFSVSSQIDSRTILDMGGAEKLLGKGDMLYLPMGENTPKRIQGCFISDEEIAKLIDYCTKQLTVKYDEDLTNAKANTTSGSSNSEGDDDPMYNEVVEFAIETGKISASLIQRRFRFGYNRAARMIDLLESRGIVGPQNGSKPREVLVKLQSTED